MVEKGVPKLLQITVARGKMLILISFKKQKKKKKKLSTLIYRGLEKSVMHFAICEFAGVDTKGLNFCPW